MDQLNHRLNIEDQTTQHKQQHVKKAIEHVGSPDDSKEPIQSVSIEIVSLT